MPLIHDEAVVLGRLDYSETSQVVVLFTRGHGKARAIAKGIKRGAKARFAAGIDLLEAGTAILSVRQERSEALATLTEWKQTRAFSGLREKLNRLHAAEYAAEITAALTEDWDPHERLHDELVATLMRLADAAEVIAEVVTFQHALLDAIGSLPRFDACMLCGRRDALTHFSSFEGGVICRHCEPAQVEKWQVSSLALSLLSGRPQRPSGAQAASVVEGAFAVLNYHIAHQMGREPRLASKLIPPARRRVVGH